ncbi:hypothetical protein [Saccharopolyspora shandongensis]|nr:hypothetical protein [Saccharopolyspora shandongensis]
MNVHSGPRTRRAVAETTGAIGQGTYTGRIGVIDDAEGVRIFGGVQRLV